jgi:RNA polymerase-associated protein LEO1
MTKLPNLVAIQPVAFEESLYIEKEEEEQYKGYVQNMIRWRYKRNADGELERDEEGQLIRESNSRMVRWSDGSFTLHIGNEVFDVQTTDSSSGGFAGLNGYVYLSQKAAFSNEGTEDDTPGGTVLECMAPVSSRFVPKPSSLQSEAHKSLTVAVRQRTIKKARIAEHVTFEDPEKAKAARIRNKEDLEKATARKSSSGNRSGGSRYRRPDMSRGYLEEDEDGDYDTTNIRALKKSNRDDDMDDYGDESDDDGFDDTFKARKRTRNQEESEEEELGVDEESDEEHETLIKAHASAKRKPQAVVDDDEED